MHLLDPFFFRNGVRAKNRVALAAMTNGQSHEDGTLGDDELAWLTRRADGGFGIVATCAAHVSKDGQGWAGELGVFDDAQLPGLKKLATALHDRGALAVAQIFHGGMRADPAVSGVRPWSAMEGAGARAATEEDIRRVIVEFGDAAVRAQTAGMDGVEIHGAHGYLLTQFLSSTNERADSWGGAFENRARLIREVTRTVRSRVAASFVVGVRISPEDFGNAKGIDLDESLQVARWLCDDGVDFVHASLWDATKNTTKRPDEHAIALFHAAIPSDVRLLVAGKLWTRADAERMLALGADVVALGRSAIANPEWALRVADAAWEPKRPPLTIDELRARGLSAPFAERMRNWKGFVV